MLCPLCGGDSQRVFEVDGYPIRDCLVCGHRFAEIDLSPVHVERVYGDDYFFAGGAGYADYLAEGPLIIEHGRRYGNMLKRHAPAGNLLDVGAAAGFILKGLVETGWSGTGIEPNARMVAYGHDTLGLDMHNTTLEQYTGQGSYDVITMIQVMAHFYDIQQVVQNATRLLKPGGLLLVETWDRASLPARLLGQNWHEYSPPGVVHWFTIPGLRGFLGRSGFVEIARGKPGKRLKGSHAKSLLRYKAGRLSPLWNLIPDNITIPYPAFDLFWSLYRFDGVTAANANQK